MEKLVLTYEQIINSIEGVKILLDAEVSYATGLKITKNIQALESILAEYATEERKLAEKYFEKDETGNYIINEGGTGFKLTPETADQYRNDLQALLHFENEVTVYKLSMRELENVIIKPRFIMLIDFMIEEDEEI